MNQKHSEYRATSKGEREEIHNEKVRGGFFFCVYSNTGWNGSMMSWGELAEYHEKFTATKELYVCERENSVNFTLVLGFETNMKIVFTTQYFVGNGPIFLSMFLLVSCRERAEKRKWRCSGQNSEIEIDKTLKRESNLGLKLGALKDGWII